MSSVKNEDKSEQLNKEIEKLKEEKNALVELIHTGKVVGVLAYLGFTALGFWKIFSAVIATETHNNISQSIAAIIIVIVISWCGLGVGVLIPLMRKDDAY